MFQSILAKDLTTEDAHKIVYGRETKQCAGVAMVSNWGLIKDLVQRVSEVEISLCLYAFLCYLHVFANFVCF